MYSLVSAIGRTKDGSRRLVDLEIGEMSVASIYHTYRDVIVILSNLFIPNNVSLKLEDVRSSIGGLSVTFNQFLINNGNGALPTSNDLPVIKTSMGGYMDGFRAGYHVDIVAPSVHPSVPLPNADKTWLYVTRENTDLDYWKLFEKRALVTVNGYLHQIMSGDNGAWIVDGRMTNLMSKQNQFGILSFANISDIDVIPIKPNMVHRLFPEQSMRHQTCINVGKDVSAKVIMLVMGGYMHILDEQTFYLVNNSTICVDMNNLPIIHRYHESMGYIDYSSLPFERSIRNDTLIAPDDFLSDENITAYLSLSQSFVVVFDNEDMFIKESFVEVTPGPGCLIAYEKPTGLLRNGVGKIADYWWVEDEGQYSVTVVDNFDHRRVYDTAVVRQLTSTGNNREPNDPVRHSKAHFLHFGIDTITT